MLRKYDEQRALANANMAPSYDHVRKMCGLFLTVRQLSMFEVVGISHLAPVHVFILVWV